MRKRVQKGTASSREFDIIRKGNKATKEMQDDIIELGRQYKKDEGKVFKTAAIASAGSAFIAGVLAGPAGSMPAALMANTSVMLIGDQLLNRKYGIGSDY